jgi:NAD(P)-dependent dehydrogenase (short-subunit alcohol dehydrogenase family)
MDLHLTDKVVVVTGAGAGIGLACVQRFVDEGALVIGADRRTTALRDIAGVRALEVDLGADGAAQEVVRAAIEEHGRIDVLANVVGLFIPRLAGFRSIADADWQASFNINLMVMVRMSRAALNHMVERESGAIVSIASDAARQAEPLLLDYSVMKAAVLHLSKGISKEFGPLGIRSNVVSPGSTRTEGFEALFRDHIGPSWGLDMEDAIERFRSEIVGSSLGRLGTPADVANAVAFLASDAAKQVTGSEYCVDGGVIRGT